MVPLKILKLFLLFGIVGGIHAQAWDPVPEDQHEAGAYFSDVSSSLPNKRFPLWFEIFYPPANFPRDQIRILIPQHGLLDQIKARPKLIKVFTNAGVVLGMFEMEGHGGSPNYNIETHAPEFFGPRNALINNISDLAESYLHFTELVQSAVMTKYGLARVPETYAYGHSAGGTVVADALLLNATHSHYGDPEIPYKGAVLSSPALDIFPFQKILGPGLEYAGREAPLLPVFPLPHFTFWNGENPSAQVFDYYDEWMAQVADSQARVVAEKPYLVRREWACFKYTQKATRRTGMAGWLHPAKTAASIILAAKARWKLLNDSVDPKLKIPFAVVLEHAFEDAVTYRGASARALQLFPEGGQRFFTQGAAPHGNVEDAGYLTNLLAYYDAIGEGKDLAQVKLVEPAKAPRLFDKFVGCVARLGAKARGTPGFGHVEKIN